MKKLIKNNREIYVTNTGLVYLNENEMKQYSDKDGYKQISLYNKGVNRMYKVHRLVAEAFIDNHLSKPQVNHKDNCKYNNDVSNLEWVTQSENLKHSYDFGGRISPMKNKKSFLCKTSKHIFQISLDGFIVADYHSAKDASLNTGICRQDICRVRSGNRKTAGGYIWA